jgi:hypothetical protein
MRHVVLAAFFPALAFAAPPKAVTPKDAPVPQPPEPGKCNYIQPQVKQCTVSTVGGVGTFDVVVTPPAGLVINFEDELKGMQPPPASSYKAIFSGTTATVVPIRRDPIAGATVHFDTATVHVTLNLKLGTTPDTQLLILDPRKAVRDEEVERRVKDALEHLDERANERADRILLEEMAASGVDFGDPEINPARHNQVVLRAKKVVRVGDRRFLLFSVDNRTGDDLEVKTVRLWVGAEGKEHELAQPPFQLPKIVRVAEESPGAVLVAVKAATSSDRLRLRVEMSNPERNVELGGIRLR